MYVYIYIFVVIIIIIIYIFYLLLLYVYIAGWTVQQLTRGATERDRIVSLAKLNTALKQLYDRIKTSPHAWPFESSVDREEVPDYYDLIINPIDLSEIGGRIKEGILLYIYIIY